MPRPRIMVVEDDILIAESTRLVLDMMGYDVVSTETTGPDAVKKARLRAPDVILMDVNLGGKMDGIEAAGKIRSRSDAPIIFTTGYADRGLMGLEDKQSFYCLIKPFNPEELQATIKKALSARAPAGPPKKKAAKG